MLFTSSPYNTFCEIGYFYYSLIWLFILEGTTSYYFKYLYSVNDSFMKINSLFNLTKRTCGDKNLLLLNRVVFPNFYMHDSMYVRYTSGQLTHSIVVAMVETLYQIVGVYQTDQHGETKHYLTYVLKGGQRFWSCSPRRSGTAHCWTTFVEKRRRNFRSHKKFP